MLHRSVDFAQIALVRMAKHQLSKSTFDRIKAEFDDLTTRGRIEVAYKIERARELGDLKENGDYHAAKDEQGHMEGRIRQIESILEDAEVVSAPTDGVVGLGSVVAIVFEGDSDSDAESYLIGHVEEKPENDSVSVMSPSSPLGSALLGAKEGDVVTYDATNAKLKVKVLSAKAQK
jgi:transcription elongation factor GreA